jgi:hypothetical protein
MKRALVLLLCLSMLMAASCTPAAGITPGSTAGADAHATPEPTPLLTPTPDPLDAIFAKEGEEIVLYQNGGEEIDPYVKGAPHPDYWLYNSHDLRVEIRQIIDEENRFTYYVADIRTRNGARETAAFGAKKPPGHTRTKPAKLARLYNAVLAINGDYLVYNEKGIKGILIRDGKLYQEGKKEDTLAFLPDMSLSVYEPEEITGQALLDLGVINALSFGPTMVKDGKLVENMRNVRRINTSRNPRSGIGMIAPGHLVAIVVEGRIKRSRGMTLNEFAQLFIDQGCTLAYNLDGGASASMVFLGNMCNTTVNDGDVYLGPRPLVDMVVFGQSDLCPTDKEAYYHNGQLVVK